MLQHNSVSFLLIWGFCIPHLFISLTESKILIIQEKYVIVIAIVLSAIINLFGNIFAVVEVEKYTYTFNKFTRKAKVVKIYEN